MKVLHGLATALALAFLATAPALADDFAYDATAPLHAVYGPAHKLAPTVTARSLVFTAPSGHKVTGEVISGAAPGPHPGVLFVHWLGDPKTTNHTEFEPDAIALAKRGVTSVLVDAMWAKDGWFDTVGSSAPDDLKGVSGQVVELRRGLDVLMAQKGVDPHRVAYVGHDFGAMFGTLLAGVDHRPSVYVLMAGVPTFSEWYLLGKIHPQRDAYVAALAGLDTTPSLNRSKARAVLFQFSAHDHYITPERAALFASTTILPKGEFFYDADHSLAVPQAFADRQAWLGEQLFGH